MKIKSPQNIELYDIQVDDRSVRYRSIMNDDSLTLYFSLPGTVSVPLGSYVDFEGQRYTLFYPENFKKHNTRNFEYTLVLHGNRELLKRFKFKDTAAIPYRLKFPLTAKPVDFVTRIVQNMNLHDSGWTVGTCIDATEKLISFNHESCFDVLGRLAQEFNTEWEIAGKTIHLRKVEKFKADPLPLSYGKGNGFKSGTGRMNDGDKIPIGRLYVQGGERNIDFSTYGSASLLLPKSATLEYEGKTYRTDAEGMSITRDGNTNIGEESYDGSDIYPKWVGIVSEVIAVDASKNLYDIKDFTIPYSLNFRDCRIPGEKATIVFQSGILAGREFDIEQTETDLTGYIQAERRFKIIPQEQDGMVMPGGAFIPAVGDKYAVFNIRMPQAYIRNDADKSGASWDMMRAAVRYFAENENQKFQFTGELDGVWSKSRWLQIGGKIVPGGHVLFSDPQFLPGGEVIRIVSVKDYVNSPHKPEITLSNAPVSGSFASGLAKLEAEEVVIEQNRRDMIRFAQRQWRDTKETQAMLEQSLLNFSGSINPVTIKTMQLIAGDESLQFRFVNSKTTPVRVDHDITFNASTKVLTAAAGIIQHMTLGITEMSTKNRVNTYKFWDISGYPSPALTSAEIPYYLYLKCNKTGTSGTYYLSETAIGMESVTGFYHFLVGIVNSEQGGDRSFAPVYGFTEILPGRITTDRIVSQDGNTFFDLLNGIIGGKISFKSGSSGLANLSEWAAAAQDIQDAQNTANQAAIDAGNAMQEAMNNVTDYNAKFATIQQQVDGEVNNWFYAYTPTPSNYPASEWTTNEIRDRHIGDTFTNTQAYVDATSTPDAGKSWRYVKNSGVYSWTPISDSDAVKALQLAAAAQSTADGKNTTYLIQPSKYQYGDAWVLATNMTVNGTAYKAGDILTAIQSSVVYNAAHWTKKVRYTDDTAVDNLQIGARNLIANSLINETSAEYGFADRTVDLTAGQQYTFSFKGKANSGATLRVYLFYPDYSNIFFPFLETNSTTDFIGKATFTSPVTAVGCHCRVYAIGGSVTINWYKLEKGSKATDWTAAPEDTQKILDDIASDNKLTPSEKQAIKKEWDVIVSEYEKICIYAGTYNVNYEDYTDIYDNLYLYLYPLLADLTVTSTVKGSDFRAAFKSYYDARQDIYNAVAVAAKTYSNNLIANLYVGGENLIVGSKRTLTAGSNNYCYSVLFGSEAKSSMNSLGAISSDNTLTAAEKSTVKGIWDAIQLEHPKIAVMADNRAVSKTAYMTAYNNLSGYITPLLADMGVDSSLTGSTFRSYFQTYYDTRQALMAASGMYLKNGASYIFSVGSISKTAGYPTGVTVLLYDFYNNTGGPLTTLNLSSNRQFYTINVPSTGYYSLIIYAGVSGSTANNVVTFDQLMLQEGNKASAFSPAVRHVTEALQGSTEIEGGLLATNLLMMKDLNGNIRGGMSGLNDNVGFWTGGTYAKALSMLAKIILRKDGSGHLAGGKINWDDKANTSVGVMRITEEGAIAVRDRDYINNQLVRLLIHQNNLDALSTLVNNPSNNYTYGPGSVYIDTSSEGLIGWKEFNAVMSLSENDYKVTVSMNLQATGYLYDMQDPKEMTLMPGISVIAMLMRNGEEYAHAGGVFADPSETRTETLNITFHNVPTGTYRLRFVWEAYPGGTAFASNITFGYERNTIVRRVEFGRDGFMLFYNNAGEKNYLYLSESNGLSIGGKTDMPGMLASGSVASNGAQNNVWGAKANAGSATPISGGFTVPLSNMTSGNYVVQITPHTNTTFRIGAKAAANFTVYGSGGFDYVVIGKN